MTRTLASDTNVSTPVSLGPLAVNGIDLGVSSVRLYLYPSDSFLQWLPYDPATNNVTLITTKPLPTESSAHSFHLRVELSYGDVTVTDVMEIFVNVTRVFPAVQPVRTAIVVNGTRKGSLVFDLTTALGSLDGLDLKLEQVDPPSITLFELRAHLVRCSNDINLSQIRASSDSVGRLVRLAFTVQQTRVLTLDVAVITDTYSKIIDELTAPLTNLAVVQSLAGSFQVTLVPGSFNDAFLSWDGNSSAIKLKQRPDYEDPEQRRFTFTLSLVHKTNASVTTDISGVVNVNDRNDETPAFAPEQYSFTVQLGALPGANLGVLSVTDNDVTPSAFSYKITHSFYESYFQIDGKTGLLSAPGILNEKVLNSTFTFPVTVSDGVNTSPKPANVTVKISNLVLKKIGTLSRELVAGVPENQPAGTFVISASQANYTEYQLVTSRDFFTIDPLTGVLTTLRPIDREEDLTQENVTVIAYPQQQTCNFEIVANVSITIEDMNDNSPVFSSKEEVSIPEHSAVGTTVITIEAYDIDFGTNASLTFNLSGPGSQLFNLDPQTGVVTVADSNALDREQNDMLRLVVTATDGRGSSLPHQYRLSTSTNLTVKLLDINDNSPVFANDSYTVEVEENVQPKVVLDLTTEVTDRDEGSNARIRYQLFEGGRGYFSLNVTTGVLRTRQPLDREQVSQFNLTIFVYDEGSPQRSASTTVTVNVVDVNDNSPAFQERNYFVTVDEGTNCSRNTILRVSASDADIGQNKVLYYSISSELLLINSDTGEIRCNVSGLDYENVNQRDFTVAVTTRDNGTQPRTGSANVRVTVRDLNDNDPLFLETGDNGYQVSVSEASFAIPNIPVYVVTVVDSDSGENGRVNLTLTSISSAVGQNLLRIDQKGVVRVNSGSGVTPGIYPFTVTATDNGPGRNSNNITLKVNVTSDSIAGIRFSENDIWLSTQEKECTQLQPIAWLNYTLSNLALHPVFTIRQGSPFHVDTATGQLFCNGSLDREAKDSYEFFAEVAANESLVLKDYALVTVTIIDGNDNAPRASLPDNYYTFETAEDRGVGHPVVSISATDRDKDNTITFSLQNTDTPFVIHPTTGQIVVNKTLDRESTEFHTLIVIIQDSGLPPLSTTLTVTIGLLDVNDNLPNFTDSSFTFSVPEDRKPGEGTGVSLTVSDPDKSANGTFGIVCEVLNPDLCPFIASKQDVSDNTIGLDLDLAPDKFLDYENVTSYVCQLRVRDNNGKPLSLSSAVNVTIHITDVNDNPPKFASAKTSVNISRADPAGHVLIPALSVTDADSAPNDEVTFSFANSGHATAYFDIDANAGKISVLMPLRDLNMSFVDLTVIVVNTEEPRLKDTIQITVYISDNNTAPEFDRSEYRLNVTEHAERPLTPILQVKAHDFEKSDRVDCNCSYTLGRVESESGRDVTGYFSIDTVTPAASVTPIAYLHQLEGIDREVTGSWIRLGLVATDNGVPPKSTEVSLNITVLDINDNAPTFSPKTLTINIDTQQCTESYKLNTTSATDDDIAPNNVIVYSVTQLSPELLPEQSRMVQVNSSTGEVTLDMGLACAVPDTDTKILFLVRAEDSDRAGIGDNLFVTAILPDPNPNAPKFDLDNYQTTISFSAKVNTTLEIGQNFIAKDSDKHNVTYSIQSGNYRDLLSMDAQSGAIRLSYLLDDNAPKTLNLTVIAVDYGNFSANHRKTGTTTVEVTIQEQTKTCYTPGEVGSLSSKAEQFEVYKGLFIALVVLLAIAIIAAVVFLYKWRVTVSDQQLSESYAGPSSQSRRSYEGLADPSGQHSSDQSGSRAKGRSADTSGLPPGLPRRPRDKYSTPGPSGEGADGLDSAGYLSPSLGQPSGETQHHAGEDFDLRPRGSSMPGDNQGQYLSLLAGGSSPYLTPGQPPTSRQSWTYLNPTSVPPAGSGDAAGTYLHPMFHPQPQEESTVTLEPEALPPPLPHFSSYNLGYSADYPPDLAHYRHSLEDDRWSPRTQRMDLPRQRPLAQEDAVPRDMRGDSGLAAVFGDGRPAMRAVPEPPRDYSPTTFGRRHQDD